MPSGRGKVTEFIISEKEKQLLKIKIFFLHVFHFHEGHLSNNNLKKTVTPNAMDQTYLSLNRVYDIICPLPVGKI